MSQETTDNFWKAWNEFAWPEPEPVSFRIYHDDQGRPVMYSMEKLDMPYIEIDAATYALCDYNIKIVDGKIIKINPQTQVKKIVPSPEGVPCDPRDVAVVVPVSKDHINWRIRTYE